MEGALLALPFGLAIGLSLGLVGGGGSILGVPVLVYVIGEPVKQATTESLVIVGATALLAGLDHARDGRVRWRIALGFGVGGAAGALAGTALNRVIDPSALLFAFALVMLAAAWAMLRRDGEGVATRRSPTCARSSSACCRSARRSDSSPGSSASGAAS